MKEQLLRTILNDLAAVEVPAERIDLTSSVIAAAEKERGHQNRATLMRRFTTGAVAILIAIVGLMVFVLPAHASLGDILKRFGLELAPEETTRNMQGTLLEPTILPVTPVPVTLDEIARQAPFVVRHPSILPEGLVYQTGGVHSRGNGEIQVMLFYRHPSMLQGPEVSGMSLEISNGNLNTYFVSEEAARDTVVSGHPAIYIRGGWTNTEPVEPGETFEGLVWDYAINDHYLTWEQDRLAYRIIITNTVLDVQSVTQIAESLE